MVNISRLDRFFNVVRSDTRLRESLAPALATSPRLVERTVTHREGQLMNILVVDDEHEILDELRGFLSRRGHTVMCVDGAVAAIRTLDENGPFDVLLTDIRMPDGSGLDVVRASLDLDRPPASFVMSGHAGADEIAQARDEGALDYFPKPVALRTLMQALAGMSGNDNGRPSPTPSRPAPRSSASRPCASRQRRRLS
jgi:two-component system response regulator PilR (NtrC family)